MRPIADPQIVGDRGVAAGEPTRTEVVPELLGVVATGVPALLEIRDEALELGMAARTSLVLGEAISLDVALDSAFVQPREAGDRAHALSLCV